MRFSCRSAPATGSFGRGFPPSPSFKVMEYTVDCDLRGNGVWSDQSSKVIYENVTGV